MGSTIAYYEKLILKPNKQEHAKYKLTFGFFIRLWLLLFVGLAGFQGNVYGQDNNYGQDSGGTSFNINLTPEVKNALDNGISLTFDCKLQQRKQWWLFSLAKNQKKYSYTLTRHTLSNRYLVLYNEAQAINNFSSASEATEFITEQSFKMLQRYARNQSDASMRLSLNKFKLLGPMRLNAFIANQWDIDTGWISWSPEI